MAVEVHVIGTRTFAAASLVSRESCMPLSILPGEVRRQSGMTTREEPLLGEERLHTGTRGPPFDYDGFASQVKVGDHVDVCDSEHKWHRARIVERNSEEVKVHYQGSQQKFDEWIPRSGRRLVPLGTKAPK